MAFRQAVLSVGSMALVFAGFVPLRPAQRCTGDHHLSTDGHHLSKEPVSRRAAAHGSHAAHHSHAAHAGGLGPAAARSVSQDSTSFAQRPCACADTLPPTTRTGARLALFDFERAKAAPRGRASLPAHSRSNSHFADSAGVRPRSLGSPAPFPCGPPGSRSCALYLIVCSILC